MGDSVSVSLDSTGVPAWEDRRAPGVSPHSEVGVVEGVHAVDVEGRALRGDPPGLPGRWTVEQGSGPEVQGGAADRGPGAVVCVAWAAEGASPARVPSGSAQRGNRPDPAGCS